MQHSFEILFDFFLPIIEIDSVLFYTEYIESKRKCFLLKRPLSLLLALIFCLLVVPSAQAANADYALYSDIVAQIDGHPLRSYIVDGNAVIVAEDLIQYGFTVDWNAKEHTLRITREAPPPEVWPDYTPSLSGHEVGERYHRIYRSDVKTYVDGKLVDSYNIGGETLIRMKSLAVFGKSIWDDDARVSNLVLDPYKPKQNLHILMYHSVVKDAPKPLSDWTTTEALFRKDLQWLRDNGYTTYLPSEIISGVPLAEKAVLITFDDGYMNNCTVALPILREFGMKAVVSIVTSYMGKTEEEFLTWDACREMAQSGLIEFGSHTHALHESGIGRLRGESREDYEQRLADDLDRSVQLIQQEIGQKNVSFFAYPHGLQNSWANNLLRDRFAMTVTTAHGMSEVSRNLYDLPRYNINSVQPVSMFLR